MNGEEDSDSSKSKTNYSLLQDRPEQKSGDLSLGKADRVNVRSKDLKPLFPLSQPLLEKDSQKYQTDDTPKISEASEVSFPYLLMQGENNISPGTAPSFSKAKNLEPNTAIKKI